MVVVWRVTEHCNLSCKFCGYDRDLLRARRNAEPESIRAFGGVLAEYQRVTGDSVLVSWLGGEPLLWRPLTDLSRVFKEEYKLRISTTTNGTCLGSREVRAHLLENYSELTISVDALGQLQDGLRGWPGGFEQLRKNVAALALEKSVYGRGPILRANVLLMRETIGGFEQLCEHLVDWGIEEVTFNQLGGNDRPEFFPAHRLLPEQADRLAAELPGLKGRLAVRGLVLRAGQGYTRRIQASARGERLAIDDCSPGRDFLFVNELGEIGPCSFTLAAYGIPIHEITSVTSLRELPGRFSEHRHRQRMPSCEDCHSTQVFEKFAA